MLHRVGHAGSAAAWCGTLGGGVTGEFAGLLTHSGLRVSRLGRLARGAVLLDLGGAAKALVFPGRPPFYRPWIELFDIDSSIYPVVEDTILDAAAAVLPPGSPLYVEYLWDAATARELEQGVHPALTRLGLRLLARGFTWFKDWYYPEGFLEGGPKLQAEKPVSLEQARRHVEEILGAARALAGRGGPLLEARARGLMALLGWALGECERHD